MLIATRATFGVFDQVQSRGYFKAMVSRDKNCRATLHRVDTIMKESLGSFTISALKESSSVTYVCTHVDASTYRVDAIVWDRCKASSDAFHELHRWHDFWFPHIYIEPGCISKKEMDLWDCDGDL